MKQNGPLVDICFCSRCSPTVCRNFLRWKRFPLSVCRPRSCKMFLDSGVAGSKVALLGSSSVRSAFLFVSSRMLFDRRCSSKTCEVCSSSLYNCTVWRVVAVYSKTAFFKNLFWFIMSRTGGVAVPSTKAGSLRKATAPKKGRSFLSFCFNCYVIAHKRAAAEEQHML